MENTIASLRPMRLGEILDQAIRLYRRNFVTFIGIIAMVHVPVTLIQLGLSYITTTGINTNATEPLQMFTPTYVTGILGSVFMAFVQLVLVQGIATAALTHAVAEGYLGQPIGIIEAYQRIRGSWMRLVLTLILAGLIVVGLLVAAFIIPCVGWLVGPGLAIFFIMAVNPLIAPTIVIEKQAAAESLRRAWDLARRRFWWLLGFIFILYLFAQLVIAGPTFVLNYVLVILVGPQTSIQPGLLTTLVSGIVSLTFSLLYLPLQLTAHALVYFDLRIRTEGFDLALLSIQFSGTEPSMEVIRELPVQPPSEKLIEWPDVGNFAILTIVVTGLYILLASLGIFLVMGVAGAMGGF